MRNTSKLLVALAATLIASVPAKADIMCTQTINRVEQGYNGEVALYFNWGTPVICSVQTTLGNVAPSSCQSWLSLIMTSFIQNKQIGLYYPQALADCSAAASLQPQSIHFFR